MIGIGRLVVIGGVTADTSIGGCIVIAVVAGSTVIGNGSVRAGKRIIIIVNREGGRFPAGRRGVAHRTIRWQVQRHVVRIGTAIEISGMAS